MKRQYYAQLDTLRLIAMLAVICYHYFTHTWTAGFLGVDVFLVLSGILLAEHLESDYQAGKRGGHLRHVVRRLGKLLGPLLFVMVICLIGLLLFKPDFLVNIKGSVWSSLLFVSNWQQIAAGNSYFANFLHPIIFTHLWYLAVYAQGFILLEAFYAFGRRFFKQPEAVGLLFLVLSVVSALLMALLFQPHTDPTRVYYGTDTRFFSMGLGVAAELLIQPTISRRRRAEKRKRKIQNGQRKPGASKERPAIRGAFDWFRDWPVDVIALLGLALAGLLMFTLTDAGTFTYYGGIFLFALIGAVTSVALLQRESWLGLLLQLPPTAALGRATYPMFLWYYPIYVIFYANASNDSWAGSHPGFQIIIIVILGFLTHWFLNRRPLSVPFFIREKGQPFRLGEEFRKLFSKTSPVTGKVLFVIMLVALPLAAFAVIQAPSDNQAQAEEQAAEERQMENAERNSRRAEQVKKQQQEQEQQSDQNEPEETPEASETEDPTALSEQAQTYYDGQSAAEQKLLGLVSDEAKAVAYDLPINFIGDSLVVGVSPAIYALYPQAIVDAKVGLQMYAAAGIIEQLQEDNLVQQNVVIALGANGAFSSKQFDTVDQAIGEGRRVYLMNTHVDRQWSGQVNTFLANKAKENPERFALLDWNAYYQNHDHESWLEPDGVHLNQEGSRHWIQFIGEAIAEDQAARRQ